MKISSIQMAAVEGDKAATIDRAVSRILQCKGADLVILPEIWNIGFMSFDRYMSEAEASEGPTLSAVRESAVKIQAHVHAGSFVEKDGDCYYNTSYLISPGGKTLGRYRKTHLFGYNSKETEILTAGDSITVVETSFGNLGMATCFDLRFPELFRTMVDRGAEIFLICSAWPYPRLEHWLMLNRVRAMENQCFLVSANSTGVNQGVQFVGHSMVVDPWGIPVASGGDQEVIISTDIELSDVHSAREAFPGLASRLEWLNEKKIQRQPSTKG